MSDFDRRVHSRGWDGTFHTTSISINGNIEVDKGDLIFQDRVDGLREQGSSTSTWYGFPFSKISGSTITLASNRTLAKQNFLGVAAWHSDSGVTENIAVYISGFFNYPIKSSRTVKTGNMIIPAGSGTTLYSQKIAVVTSSVTDRIGIAGETGTFKSSVKFSISTLIKSFSSTVY